MNRTIAVVCLVVASLGFHAKVAPAAAEKPQFKKAATNLFDKDPRILSWHELDVECHQLVGDRQGSQACAKRIKAAIKLNHQGLCFGKKGQKEYQYSWHKCRSDSLRFGKKSSKREK